MTIPFDPENRWWIEVSGSNPRLVDDLRPCILTLVAFDAYGDPSIIGTGFVVSGNRHIAVVFTAKHVLSEGALWKQRPVPKHALSALFVPRSQTLPSIDPTKLKVFWMGSKSALAMNLVSANYNDTLDIAACILSPQEIDDDLFTPTSIPIDTSVPNRGDVVHLISQDGFNLVTKDPGDHREILLSRRISIRIGIVTDVHPNGYGRYQWPCFTTSIPAEPGMSGGFVFLPEDGKTISACGIVSADNSTEQSRSDPFSCGESVIACNWPALGMTLPEKGLNSERPTDRSLISLMQSGNIPMAVNGIEHVVIERSDEGGHRIFLKD